jgi:hypothetical protein
MTSWRSLPLLALLSFGGAAVAQDTGGVALSPNIKGGPVGLARPLPFVRPPLVTAHEAQGGLTAADHQAINQNTITNLRGDPGFLSGFAFGQPLAASVQPALPDGTGHHRHHGQGQAPVIINNAGPVAVTIGNGNVVQQSSANGSGPIAQQQIATTPSAGSSTGGATNLVTGGGNIIQKAPGH